MLATLFGAAPPPVNAAGRKLVIWRDSANLYKELIAVNCVTGKAHNLAGAGPVDKCGDSVLRARTFF